MDFFRLCLQCLLGLKFWVDISFCLCFFFLNYFDSRRWTCQTNRIIWTLLVFQQCDYFWFYKLLMIYVFMFCQDDTNYLSTSTGCILLFFKNIICPSGMPNEPEGKRSLVCLPIEYTLCQCCFTLWLANTHLINHLYK